MTYYEACDADGHMRFFGCRFAEDELEDARRKADRLKGYVRVAHNGSTVYHSPVYLKKYPLGGGSGGGGGMERVNPPASLWTDEGRPDWVAP